METEKPEELPADGQETMSLGRDSHGLVDGQIPASPEDEDDRDTQNLVFTVPVDHSGTSVYLKGWLQPESPFPPLVLVHDLGENVRMYKNFAKELGDKGFHVYGFDLRGHGRSGRLLGYVPHFESLVDDLLQVVAWIRYKSNRQLPIIVGQGVGGLITIFFHKKYPEYVRQCVLVAPVISEGDTMSPFYRTFIRTMAEIAPRMRLPRAIVPQFLSLGGTEPSKKQQKFQGITLNFAKEVMNAIGEVPQAITAFNSPGMIIAPQQVGRYDLKALKEMLSGLESEYDISLVEVSNIGTQPLTTQEELLVVLDSIYPWLEEQLGTSIER
ncbi:alpha/beta hydrolase [Pseudobacteriovorax antillogorgiicola]|uniref:Serine aminopeptidase, S33 n=2 Tax=Pseudobacteriovorax antillogorgiicola TaxID=1513793 RepID=A0A1Y6C7G1_9BACT|nr:alpha/beta fold hydrolase [Pseudobacteriovorax antillogorgiicola]TCS49334.1 serine aminopeptidase S33 family [Pseudobacteriovorax antillogorgiicola]SMF47966.1 Serine aminopeptidase, S33 [Pseudobacteriovorax antillogorgiicola]